MKDSDNYWDEIGLPLWALEHFKEPCNCQQFYSVFSHEKRIAYCSSCGKTLDYEEGKESYE